MYLYTYVYAYIPQNEDLYAYLTQKRQFLCQKCNFISTTSYEQKKSNREKVHVCARERLCVYVCAGVCACVRVRARARVCVYTHRWYG